MCGRVTGPKSPRLKFTVVGFHTSVLCSTELTYKKRVTELNRAVHASRTKSEVGNSLCRYLILHGSLLNHMIIITKVGVSYIDHMNDDAPAVNSLKCARALSRGERLGKRL